MVFVWQRWSLIPALMSLNLLHPSFSSDICIQAGSRKGDCAFVSDFCGWTSTPGFKIKIGNNNTYAKARMSNKAANSTVRLQSPKLQATDQQCNLKFRYYSGALERCQLSVLALTENNISSFLWKGKGSTVEWQTIPSPIEINCTGCHNSSFKIIFEGKKLMDKPCGDFYDEIDIDDIEYRCTGSPSKTPPTVFTSLKEGICTFTDGFCGWESYFGFEQYKEIGFAKAEMSYKSANTTVRLLSPWFCATDQQCSIAFWYYYGHPERCQLSVLLLRENNISSIVWTGSKDTGIEWHNISLPLIEQNMASSFQVVFEGRKLTKEPCSAQFDEFEIGNIEYTCTGSLSTTQSNVLTSKEQEIHTDTHGKETMAEIVIPMLFAVATKFQVQESCIAQCPDTWITFHNSCYKYVATSTNWYYANVICSSAGGHLVTIESESENRFVTSLAQERNNSAWIGLNDIMDEGRFIWYHNQQEPIYRKWASGQPDDHARNEDCGHLYIKQEFKWNDFHCSAETPFICERN